MTIGQLERLPVNDIRHSGASFLFIWTVNAYVEATYGIARAWGFRPVSLLTWCKQPLGIGPGGAFATTTEFILYCRAGSDSEIGRRKAIPTSWFTWPRGGQSEKPEAFLDLVEENFPGPYLELFARRQRLGWDTWGNEALCHVGLAS
jgi:N6-adenosine-specific RNA methylase IME4